MPKQQVLDPTCTETARAPNLSQPVRLPANVRKFGFIPDFGDWLHGDLLLFSKISRNLIERQIVNTQTSLGHAPEDARWHHAAVYIGDGFLCEARPGGVRYRPVVESVDQHTLLRVRRSMDTNETERFRIAIHALMRLSRSYAYGSVIQTLFRPFSPSRFALALRPRKRALICSQLYHDVFAEVSGSNLIDYVDKDIVPAELSATHKLQDVKPYWIRLS